MTRDAKLKSISETLKKQLKGKRKTTRNVIRDLKPENFKYLASGLSRVCFIHKSGKYVLKIEKARSRRNYQQNRKEVKNYQNLPENLKKHFVEPLAWDKGFSWVLMRKAETREDDLPYDELSKIEDTMCAMVRKNKLRLSDIHAGNVGLLDNKPVIFDYGFDDIIKH